MVTQERLIELIDYNPHTGVALWKPRGRSDFDCAYSGKVVGCKTSINGREFITCKVDGVQMAMHRVAFMIHFGWVPKIIDHIDGDSTNNKIANLRDGTHSINNKNARRRRDNTSGVGGIYKHTSTGKWTVRVSIGGKRAHIGCFDDFFEACCARFSASIKDKYTERHGI